MKKELSLAALLFCPAAHADVKNVQYQLDGVLYTGTLNVEDYSLSTNLIQTSGAKGFKKEAGLFPAEPTPDVSFKAVFGDVSYRFGTEWIGVNMLLSYRESPLVTFTFKVTHIGIRYVENMKFYFFDLEVL